MTFMRDGLYQKKFFNFVLDKFFFGSTFKVCRQKMSTSHCKSAIRETAMKTIITAAAVLFTANVSATSVYHGLDAGNTDLNSSQPSAVEVTGMQPSVGDRPDIYGRFDDGNADLFKGDGTQSPTSTGRPDIYMNVSGNPDLQF